MSAEKILIESLEDLYIELEVQEGKFQSLKEKVKSTIVAYYNLLEPSYLDLCEVGHIIKDLISGKSPSVSEAQAKALQKYVFIKTTTVKPTVKGTLSVGFRHIGSDKKNDWVNSSFSPDIDQSIFKPGYCYVIVDKAIGRKHNWVFAQELPEDVAIRVADILKKIVGRTRYA